LRLLDAGCGKGWLTDSLSTIGHDVTGIDTSATAIEICRKHRQGTFAEASLHEFSDPVGFDAAVSLDVMFHILDDEVWRRSLRNLAANLRSGGLLVLSDTNVEAQTTSGNYIVYRPVSEYLSALVPFKAKLVATRAYQFSDNHNTLLALKVS
jgi:2-polyprenyl-3-methyl-5-hydroxy-6-metoxy-1,4-benzoquinol methylase